MKKKLLKYLCCLSCKNELQLKNHCNGDEVLEGTLSCIHCKEKYPIINGIPVFVKFSSKNKLQLTAQNFGYAWRKFSRTSEKYYYKQFLDWINPINEEFLKEKFVLDGGCGKGHHLLMISPYVKEAIGVDLSDSVFIAYNNTKHLSNIHIIKADLNNLPLKDEMFDYIYSIGVIHHTEHPQLTTQSLYKMLKKDSKMSFWVYGKENNWWIIYLINPIRKFMSRRFHISIIHLISFFIAILLYLILKLIYLPVKKFKILNSLSKMLFYYPYLSYISEFDFTEITGIIFDHLVAPISHYLSRKEIENIVNINSSRANIEWHNQNSWRILVTK